MRITSSVEYATRLMVALSRAFGQTPLSAETLSETENVPVDYVNQILLRLKRAGLVESHRGIRGGYTLSKRPEQVKLGQVVRAVEGEIFESVCGRYEGGKKDCHHQGRCGISPVWRRLGAMIEEYFDGITLDNLMQEQGMPCPVKLEGLFHER
ncbi:MAG: Rrf2 family transcriptional regulator [Elusimicrobia bacterium]|nr:Rrf2 family transcriptional regulator [Elusimicrobiota bacterium]